MGLGLLRVMTGGPIAPSYDNDEYHLDGTDTYHGYWSGCSGTFITAPGVFGSSTISGSGGCAEPRDLVFRQTRSDVIH